MKFIKSFLFFTLTLFSISAFADIKLVSFSREDQLTNLIKLLDHQDKVVEWVKSNTTNKASTDNGAYGYILAGPTCLACDVVGRYFFENELKIGQRLAFEDMAIYSMCKNNTFNWMKLPDICLIEEDGKLTTLKSFGYQDFKYRLGM